MHCLNGFIAGDLPPVLQIPCETVPQKTGCTQKFLPLLLVLLLSFSASVLLCCCSAVSSRRCCCCRYGWWCFVVVLVDHVVVVQSGDMLKAVAI